MKNFTSLRLFLATVLLAMVAGTAFGATEVEETFDFTAMSANSAGEQKVTSGDVSIVVSNGAISLQTSTMQLRWYSGQTLTVSVPTGASITSIAITKGANDKGVISTSTSGFSVPENESGNGNVVTATGSANPVVLSTAGQARVTKIVVKYEVDETDTRTVASWSVDPSEVEVTVDESATATITTDFDQALSVVSKDPSVATATISGKVITVTGVAVGTTTLTVTGNGSTTYKDLEKTISVTVNAAPEPVEAGDVTFDAKKDKGTSSSATTTYSITKGGVTFSADKGTNNNAGIGGNGTYYSLYKGAVGTFTAAEGYKITSIVFTNNGESNRVGDSFSSDMEGWESSSNTWTGLEQSVSFTATNAQARFSKVVVTIVDASNIVDAPTFSLESGTYKEVKLVTLTQDEAGYIMYTIDGTDPSYANENGELINSGEAVAINYSLTLKAIAVNASGAESPVVSRTYTIKPDAPTLTEGGNFNAPVEVEMIDEAGNDILYTLNGTTPSWDNDDSEIYDGNAVTISTTTTVTAVSVLEVKDGTKTFYNYSDPVVVTYSIKDAAEVDVTFNFGDDTWREENDVEINGSLGYQLVRSDGLYPIEVDGVGVGAYDNGIQSKPAVYSDALRVYKGGEFAFYSTNGQPITQIKLTFATKDGNGSNITLADDQVGSYADGTFTASASDNLVVVRFTTTITSKHSKITTATVTTKSDATVTEDVTITGAGFGTLFTEQPFEVPEGMTAGIITAAGEADAEGIATLTLDWAYNAGDIVPAATPLLIKGDAKTYTYTCKGTVEAAPTGNLLHGSATATETTGEAGDLFYMLSYGKGERADQLGFYYKNSDGSAFTSAAGKCWLALPGTSGVKGFVFVDSEVTGINSAATINGEAATVYDLQGRRVSAPAKGGIYIVGGKKVLVK